MTRQELVTRLTIYKKEMYRRGLVIALCSLLPGSALIVGLGIWLQPFTGALWEGIVFFGILLGFMTLNFLAFVYTIWKSLPKKLDLNCPNCGEFIMNTPPQRLIESGTCGGCGARLLEAETQAVHFVNAQCI